MSNEPKLTEKQKKFADYYIQSGNATQAAQLAGYSENTSSEMGYENLRKPQISSYIKERTEKASNKRIADIVERKELLTSFMRNQEDTDDKGRLKALEILGKMEGDFTEKIEITGSLAGIIKESRERG